MNNFTTLQVMLNHNAMFDSTLQDFLSYYNLGYSNILI